jgi:Spy/CpxP family protein refolding chaperone
MNRRRKMTNFRLNIASALLAGLLTSGLAAIAQEAGAPPEEPVTAALVQDQPGTDALEGFAIMLPDENFAALPMSSYGHHMGGWGERMELTDDQKDKLHDLKNQFLDTIGPKYLAVASAERKLKDVLFAKEVDSQRAKSLQTDINNLKTEISNIKLDHKLSVMNTLTAKQREDLRYGSCGGGKFGHGEHKMHHRSSMH